MTSMQVTSKKEQTGGIEWLPLEVFAAFSGEEGGRRGWMDEGRGECTEIKIKNTQRSKWEPSRLTSGKRDGGRARGVEGWRLEVVVEEEGGGPCCCISMGAVQIPRDYWREKRGERKNDARLLGSVMTG